MSIDSEKLKRVLERNLNELSNCILKRRAYNSLLALKSSHNLNFFRVSAHALHNDLYADAHRVFDKHKDVTTFWYVQKVSPEAFSKAALAANVSVTELELIANKLVHLR